MSDTPPWSQSEPQICLSLKKYKKIPQILKCINKQALVEITSRHQNYVQIFTDGSKVDEKVAAAAVSSVAPSSPFSCRLRDHCSIYTAELQAILLALKQAYQSQESKFMIFSDSLSALQALGKLKTDHPLLIQIQEFLHKINADQKEIVFMWVPGHVGIRGNEA
ncbi:ribonuclease H family protein, partial [Thiolapillus sp.]|uniref:ribonuclease H family protein n=1 Tax=Thiolapillus sp. TaxID=2017437 RepID=UPI003AF87D5D